MLGEYVTGYTGNGASKSDKKIGVVGLTLFDLRRLGRVDKLSMAGVNGSRFPAIRRHFEQNIAGVYKDMDVRFVSFALLRSHLFHFLFFIFIFGSLYLQYSGICLALRVIQKKGKRIQKLVGPPPLSSDISRFDFLIVAHIMHA